jgi:alpha-tubulin suppressor-like RCC1 family protein
MDCVRSDGVFRSVHSTALVLAFTLVLVSCSGTDVTGGDSRPQGAARIVGIPAELKLPVGDRFRLQPTTESSTGKPIEGIPVIAKSLDPDLIRVEQGLLLLALAPGQARIELTAGAARLEISLTVEPVKWRVISGTVDNTCGVTQTGAVYCWGGQREHVISPNQVDSFCQPMYSSAFTLPCVHRPVRNDASRQLLVKDILLGVNHVCVLDLEGAAHCWGRNQYGQLGIGVFGGEYAAPQPVQGAHRFQRLLQYGYSNFTCGMKEDGQVWCWGRVSIQEPVSEPRPVLGGRLLRAYSSNGETHCAVTSEGEALCWGRNDRGQVGDGGSTSRTEPSSLAINALDVSISSPICIITQGNELTCWSWDGLSRQSGGPERVESEASLVSLMQGGGGSMCGLTGTGDAYCWGAGRNTNGSMGHGDTEGSLTPRRVVGGHRFSNISGGWGQVCGITIESGGGYCWGSNRAGQGGNGTTQNSLAPKRISEPWIP